MAAPTLNVMLDMETLDTVASSVVLSMGAVLFSPAGIHSTSYMEFDIDDQLRRGRTVSASTLAWWMGQGEEARAVITQNKRVKEKLNVESLKYFMAPLEVSGQAFVGPRDKVFYNAYLWSNGASFDIPMWEHLHRELAHPSPFFFGKHMCFRTYNALTNCKALVPDEGVKHNALDDAIWQAKCVMAYMNRKKANAK